MNSTVPEEINPIQQFDRFLQKLGERNADKAVLTGDETSVISLPSGSTNGPPITTQRLETLLRSLPAERITARHVSGLFTTIVYASASGTWNLRIDRSAAKPQMEITPHAASPASALPIVAPHAGQTAARPQRRKPVALLTVTGIAIVLALAAVGVLWNQNRLEENRLQAIRQQLKSIVLADNALALEILDLDESSHITYAEFFKRAEKNRESRSDLIRQIRAIEAGPYEKDAQNFIRLMELETEFVRCEEAVSRQSMEVSTFGEALRDITASSEKASEEFQAAREDYLATPYGEDYSEKFAMDIAAGKARQAQAAGIEAIKQYEKARTLMQKKMDEAVVTANAWISAERRLYPWSFAPPRDVIGKLIEKKSKYVVKSAGEPSQNSSAKSNAKKVSVSSAEIPSRMRSKEVFEGERFPETRLREISADEVVALSDDDLRYAINEMYARYGMTFRDKNYQANFEGFKWYRPDDKWTVQQIERAFNATERKNLAVLIDERTYRQNSGISD